MPATPFDPATVTAAVLAGGAGARLGGRDKGLELLGGKSLVAHVLAALEGQAGTVVICANRNEAHYRQYARTLHDATPDFRGPLAGITAALAQCSTEWLLTVPVDCPRPPSSLALRLHAAALSPPAMLAVAHDGERTQPLFALYARALAGSALSALQADAAVWRWQQDCAAARADFADFAAAFENLNTPEELRRWEREHG